MSEPLCKLAAGELRASSLASILIEALRNRATGELTIEASGGTSRVYLREGHPRGIQIFFGFKPLGQFLLELGWIDIQALERSLLAMADGRKQGEALVDLGFLAAEQVRMALALLHRAHLRTLADIQEGTWAFASRSELPSWTEEIRIGAHRAIVDALGAGSGRVTARRILEELRPGCELRLRSDWETYATHFEFDDDEAAFVRGLREPQEFPGLLASAAVGEHRARALTAALVLMGIVVAKGEGPAARQVSVATAEYGTPGPSARRVPVATTEYGTPGPSARQVPVATAEYGTPGPSARQVPVATAAFGTPGPSARRASPARDVAAHGANDEAERIARFIGERWPAVASGDRFAVLGLGREATGAQIKQAYLEAVKLLHPDRLPASLSHLGARARELFEAAALANELLSDEKKRKEYLAEAGKPKVAGPIRSADVRQLVAKGEQLLGLRRFGQALAFFKQALLMEDHPDVRAHVIWAANSDPARPTPDRAQRELERLAERHPECTVASGYLSRLRSS